MSRALARGGAATVGGPEWRPQGQARADGGSGPAQTLGGSARMRGAGARALAWLKRLAVQAARRAGRQSARGRRWRRG
jgi:hypothetical protein